MDCRKVASFNTSCLEAHAGFFRLLMNGIFDAYVLQPFLKKNTFESLTRISTHDSTVWQYGLWSFQTGGTKLERFLHKNQHTQRKLLNFENWISGGLRSFQKSEF